VSHSFTTSVMLDLRVDDEVVLSLPFSDLDEAEAFGDDWVKRNDRWAAMERHPAGKRR
jgi:hypothetical protein